MRSHALTLYIYQEGYYGKLSPTFMAEEKREERAILLECLVLHDEEHMQHHVNFVNIKNLL